VPSVSALVGSNASAPGGYMLQCRLWFFADALAFLTVVPAILSWVRDGREWSRRPYNYLEFAALMTLLVFFGYLTFMGPGRGEQPALLYSLVPLLLWAALRLGLKGVSTSMVVVALLAIWGAAHGRGPFSEQGPLSNALSLQLFLFFAAIPFTVLAVLVEEQKRVQRALADEEAQLTEAQHLAQMGSWQWDPKTDAVTWSDGIYRIFGYDPKLSPPTFKDHKQFFTPESWDRLYRSAEHAMQTGEPYALDLEGFRLDGTRLWMTSRGEAIRDADNHPVLLRGTIENITERKRAENALRESEARFRLAAQAGKMFAYEWDAATDVIVRSGESAKILGIDEATLSTGQQALATVHPDDREGLLAAMAGLGPEKPQLQVSYRMVRPDGTVIWVERNSRAHFDKQGRILRIVGMVVDVTERKLTETELTLANDRLRSAMEAVKSVGWDRDVRTGRDTLFGDLQGMFGIPSEVYDGLVEDFHRYLHPEDRRRVMEAIDGAMESKKPYAAEFRILRPDGIVRWVGARGKFYYSPEGEPERMLGMAIDITERKLVQDALRESEERLRLAAQVGKMFAYEWDVATDVTTRSEEAVHILGLPGGSTKAIHGQVLASVHPEDRAKLISTIAALSPESPNLRTSFRFLRPDGSVLWLERTGHAFFDEEGRMVRMIGMVADVNERKLAEEALAKVGGRLIEAHEEERTWIARELDDDIGQQLALLVNNLVLMKEDLPDSVAEFRNRVSEQLKRVHEISADVQALSHRLHSSKLRYLGIVAAAKSFCQELSEQHKVEIDFTHADIPPTVPEEISLCLFRVMQEALQNAVKYSGVRHFEAELRGASDGIHLTVRDAGVGFDRETVVSNRGLGLVSMQERVNLEKGTFSIDSQPGRGTTIHIWLPLSARGEAARAAGD
jgi:PAS domain S-box-containing protein